MSRLVRILVADRGDSGVRLDLVVRRHLRDVEAATRTRVQAWIEGGQVTVNGATIRRVAARAALGDVVSVVVPEPKPRRAMSAEDVALEILYEDDHLLALNKPAGVVVHPAYKHPTGTLMNALLWRARAWPDGGRPSIVGRLDKETTGIVLVAKTPAVHASLQRALTVARPPTLAARAKPERLRQSGTDAFPSKEYLAVVYGRVPARGEIDLRLRLNPRDRRRVVASESVGAHSVTEFERLAHVRAPRAGLALLRCRLVTGRRHQIRVHLAARGWPIVGDAVYGEPGWTAVDDPMLQSALRAFPRQALHAWRVAFRHPITGEPVRIEAPVPRDMSDLVAMAELTAAAIS
jgi:23S rRNA pseudouridine1911/1915/1917 synthase